MTLSAEQHFTQVTTLILAVALSQETAKGKLCPSATYHRNIKFFGNSEDVGFDVTALTPTSTVEAEVEHSQQRNLTQIESFYRNKYGTADFAALFMMHWLVTALRNFSLDSEAWAKFSTAPSKILDLLRAFIHEISAAFTVSPLSLVHCTQFSGRGSFISGTPGTTQTYARGPKGQPINARAGVYRIHTTTVFITNVNYRATSNDLHQHFAQVAGLTRCQILWRGRGSATYNSSEKAQEAVQRFNETPFLGRIIRVRLDFTDALAPSEPLIANGSHP